MISLAFTSLHCESLHQAVQTYLELYQMLLYVWKTRRDQEAELQSKSFVKTCKIFSLHIVLELMQY